MSFSPTSIANLILWLDAADSSTITFSSGSNVSQWNDKSTNLKHMTQSTTSIQPILGTMANGLKSLNFGGNRFLQNTSIVFPNAPYTVFAIGDGSGTSFGRLLNATTDNRFFLGADSTGVNYASFVGNGVNWNATDVNVPNYNCNNLCMMELTNSGTTTGLIPYFNGNVQNAKNGTTASFTGLTVGRGYVANDQCWNGHVSEVIIYSSILTSTQREQVEGYLAWRWGLQTSLPTNHTYRNSPSLKVNSNIVVSPIINTFYGNAIFNIGATTNNTETSIVYTSGNTYIATVNSFGNVTVGNVGNTTISMTQLETTNYLGITANTTIYVSKVISNITANTTFNVTYKSSPFNIGATTNNTETPIVYTSGNTFIATVDSFGNVIAGNVGNVTISMTQSETTNYLGITANTTVNVAKIQPNISVISSLIQTMGDSSFNLGATTTNTDTSIIQYTSTNPNVANVVDDVVTIGNSGIATITSYLPETANYFAVSANTTINVASISYQPKYAVDNRFIPASIVEWRSVESTYNETTGEYTGSQSTTYNTSLSASGEWLQLKINSAIVAKYYHLSWFIDSSTNSYTIPKSWILLGSTDTTSWSLIDSFNYQLNTAPTNTSAKPVLIKLRNIYTNNLNVQWYRLIVTSIFPGGSLSYTRISEMDFFAENANTLNINRWIKPIVTRTHVLHPITIIPFSTKMEDQTVYMLTDLCCNLIENNTINNGYNNTNIIKGADKKPITSSCFDGQNLMATPMTGNICYINNDGMNTNLNFDISLNGSLFQKNITGNIYTSCFNGQRIIMGGTGTNVISYISPLQNSPDATFKPALNANHLMTSVFGLASNSGYGHVYIPNRIYMSSGDRLSVVAPKSYNQHLSDTNTISMNLNNATITKNI